MYEGLNLDDNPNGHPHIVTNEIRTMPEGRID